jgi:hypothetical protein
VIGVIIVLAVGIDMWRGEFGRLVGLRRVGGPAEHTATREGEKP